MASTTHPEYHADTEALEVAKDFADGIKGKSIIVTGVNKGGIGYSTAQAFASQSPSHIIITGRNSEKLQISIDALKSEYPDVDYRALKMDLSSQKSVRAAAAEVLSWNDIPQIDILVNSAGICGEPQRSLSEDGIEMHMAVNHIGHFLFTNLIMPKIIAAAKNSPRGATRIVNVSSASPRASNMRWSDINFEKKNKDLPKEEQPLTGWMKEWGTENPEEETYIPIDGYNRSKVANVLFSIGSNHRLYESHGIVSTTVHPGVIRTELGRSFPEETLAAVKILFDRGLYRYKSQGAGAATSLVAALDRKLKTEGSKDGKENYGVYLADCQISNNAHPLAVSSSEAEKLWSLSESLVKQEFVW